MQQTYLWRKWNGQQLSKPATEEFSDMLQQELQQGHQLTVCIGTDSQVKGKVTHFATVLVFVRKGKGAFMYLHKQQTTIPMTVKERMLDEVNRSIETAYQLAPLFTKYKVPMEVHVDINTNAQFKSNAALKDAIGYISGMGFVFKAKPQAFASSACADKAVH